MNNLLVFCVPEQKGKKRYENPEYLWTRELDEADAYIEDSGEEHDEVEEHMEDSGKEPDVVEERRWRQGGAAQGAKQPGQELRGWGLTIID